MARDVVGLGEGDGDGDADTIATGYSPVRDCPGCGGAHAAASNRSAATDNARPLLMNAARV
jgi:hypothetical protein